MKRKIACLIALVMSFTLIAAVAAAEEPVTFTFYSEDGTREQPWTTVIAQKITELTGVSLQFDYPVGGLGIRIPLMTAQREYPDIIYGKGDGAAQLIEAEAVINLAEMIENSKYLKDFYGELLPRLWYNGDPDVIYSVGAYAIWAPVWNAQSALPIQAAVLKEFDFPMIRTVYEAEELMREYIKKYPTTPDGKPVYMLSLNNADGWRYIIDLGNPSGFLAGFPDHGEWIIDETTYEATIKYLHPAIKEFYAWLNKLWNEGFIDPDCFTQTHDDWTAKMANGQILATVSPQWMMNEPEQAMRQLGLEDRVYAHLPITWSEDVKSIGTYDNGWSGGWGVMITTSCADPQRAFDYIDWTASDEGLVLRNWGIEGIHYDVVDGIRVLKPEVQEALRADPDYGNSQGFDWAYPFPEIGDGIKDSTGSTYTRNTPKLIIENYTETNKEALEAYGATMWADLFPATTDFPLSPFGAAWQIDIPTDSEINDLMTWVQSTWLPQELAKCVMASPENFEAQWEASQQLLIDGGVLRLNEMFTELVKAKAAAWGN
ncbi:MAG: extracellular solute-binding protein [Clostridia bacterium]|nr:extracellular solute-binding protein [Clostridia bacterium]